MAKSTGTTKKSCEAMIKQLTSEITQALARGEDVKLVGFGVFEVKNRAARIGINPRTKERFEIKESKAVSFRAGQDLKKSIK